MAGRSRRGHTETKIVRLRCDSLGLSTSLFEVSQIVLGPKWMAAGGGGGGELLRVRLEYHVVVGGLPFSRPPHPQLKSVQRTSDA